MKKTAMVMGALAVVAGGIGVAQAHIGVSGQLPAGGSGILTFGVGHGCEGVDTVRVRIAIPEEVTAVRGLTSAWGEGTFERDATDRVVAVTFEKADARAIDDQYYQFSLRVTAPDAAFSTLYFPVTQTCRTPEGVESETLWDDIGAHDDPAVVDPAATAVIFPARTLGWNRYTVPAEIHDLEIFDDARIVWAGTAAYSANAETTALIESDPDVDALEEIPAGQEIWVLY